MKSMSLAAIAVLAFAYIGSAMAGQKKCNFDPVCQAKRDGVSVQSKLEEQARWRARHGRGHTVGQPGGSGARY